MNEKKDNALVPRPSGAVEKVVPGVKRILSGMVSDTLALASSEQRALAPRKFRIGDYEWCGPDYRQILIWAELTGLKLEEVIARLFDQQSLHEGSLLRWVVGPSYVEPLFADGRLLKVDLDLRLLPCRRLEWVNGLEITHLRIIETSDMTDTAWLSDLGPLPLSRLVSLACSELGLTHLNLTGVPQLKDLDCRENRLEELQLYCVPQLNILECGKNELADLKLDQTPNLQKLSCWGNRLTKLDLSGLHWLEFVACDKNKLTELKLGDLPNLMYLLCGENYLNEWNLEEVPELHSFNCSSNQISKLDLSQCPKLWHLQCSQNQLTSLDLHSVQELTELNCANNAISELDLSSCPNLKEVHCSGNPIAVLDIRGLKHLRKLERSSYTKVIMDPEQQRTVQDIGVQ